MHGVAADAVAGVTASVVVLITIIWPLLVPPTELTIRLPFGSTSIPSALVNPGVGTGTTVGVLVGAGMPPLTSPPGGRAPPGPRGSLNCVSEPAPAGAAVSEIQTAFQVMIGSFIVFGGPTGRIVYAASSAPESAS